MTGFPPISHHRAYAVTLARYPESQGSAVHTIDACVCREPDGNLRVTYLIQGDLERVRIPKPGPSRIGDRLWQHTCCEIFIRCNGAPAYHEFNFAPSGAWAAYAFRRYREGEPLLDDTLQPYLTVRRDAQKLELHAAIRLASLSPEHLHRKLAIGLTAVVEDEAGALSYWALRHPAGKPDFHHADGFALTLENV